MKNKKISEGLSELASATDLDHEVQMARAELYKIADYAIKLHSLLKNVSEEEGIEAWQQSKITKAADYIGSVFHALDYDKKTQSPVGPPAIVAPATAMPSIPGQLGMSESEVNNYKSLLEKAKSKAQQKFMGMVYAAKSGEKPASKEVAKAAKGMSKSDAKDYAKTKHKGLPAHVSEDPDDDDNTRNSVTRQASNPGQAAAWKKDAIDRSEAALRKYPEFFTNDHLDRVDAIYDIIDRVLTPSRIFVTHRFGGKTGPFTAFSIYDPTWPSTMGRSRSVRDRDFYEPIAKLGGVYHEPLKSGSPGFIMHVTK